MDNTNKDDLETKPTPGGSNGYSRSRQNVDADEALKAFQMSGCETVELDAATNKRLLRRIDLIMMPILCVAYGLSYLDKTTLSYASVMGIQKDIGLKGDNYQWLGSIFYFGYLAWEMPAGRLLQLLPLAKYNGACLVLWGLVLSCFVAVHNFGGAVALRFFLGALEASITPGFGLITSQWYTKSEQAARIGYWVSFNGFGQIFGGLVAYGIARGNADYTLAGWKIVFLLCGLLTIVVGTTFVIVIPDSQLNARWLSSKDRLLAIERVRTNNQGIGNKTWKFYQFKEALEDPQTWAIFILAVALDIGNGGLSNFFNQLIVSFGYTEEQSLLYGIPGGAVEVITLIAWGWACQKYGNRTFWSILGVCVGLLGAILMVALPLEMKVGRLVGYYLTTPYVTGFVLGVSLVASNTAGYTKKTTVGAIFLIGYCAGNIIGPQTYRPQDAPRYMSAEITIIVIMCIAIIDLLFIYWYSRHRNMKKAKLRAQPGYQKLENQEFLDLTDKENPEFVYAL